MRTRVVWLMAALMIGLAASAPGQAQQVTNLFTNGGFESGAMAPYGTYGTCTTRSRHAMRGGDRSRRADGGQVLPARRGSRRRDQ